MERSYSGAYTVTFGIVRSPNWFRNFNNTCSKTHIKNIPKWLISVITPQLDDINKRKFVKMNDNSGCIKDQRFAQNS
jgi:hypothetical protein